jgi:hypothetical protein
MEGFKILRWRVGYSLDLSFDNEPSAGSTNFGDKAALPSCITEVNGQYVWEDGNKSR